MALEDMMPWRRGRKDASLVKRYEQPFYGLQRQINKMFDDFFTGFDMEPFGRFAERQSVFNPRVNVTEDDKNILVDAELPGMDEKNIELTLTKDALTIKGEKKEQQEEKKRDYYRMECSYGAFERVVPLPVEIDEQKVEAEFKKGLLTVKLPKSAGAQKEKKKIEIKTA